MEIKRGKNEDLISKISLEKDLKDVIDKLNPYNNEILKKIFSKQYEEFEEVINNIQNSNKSDIIISYGNNNYVSKFLINDIIKTKSQADNQFQFKTINFNSHIHTTEDIIIKRFCKELGIDTDKTGFDAARSAIEEYYKNMEIKRKNQTKKSAKDENDIFIILFFENIEHLFLKKKQVLFYTLLEIVSISSNILFCGMTSNFNLMDLMEKRIRSRFSQKTIFIRISDTNSILGVLDDLFNNSNNFDEKSKSSLQIFYQTLISLNKIEDKDDGRHSIDRLNFNLIVLIEKYVNLGMSIKEIITKLKYILTMIMMNIKKHTDPDIFNFRKWLTEIINMVITDYVIEEMNGSFFNLLKNFPKLHLVLLICLWRCVGKYKEKITVGMIYQEYSLFCNPKSTYSNTGLNKTKLDLIVVKKALEELLNSNLISVKNDEKYLLVYELKLPYETTQKVINKLEDYNNFNFDNEMKQFLNVSFG